MTSTAILGVGAAVFLKPVDRSKTRLSHLPLASRSGLAQAMACDVLSAVMACGLFHTVFLVGSDPAAKAHAAWDRMEVFDEGPVQGLNEAADAVVQAMRERGIQHVALLPADLPLIDARSLSAVTLELLTRVRAGAEFGITPCRRDDGTNLLVCDTAAPPVFSYGAASFSAHVAQGAASAVVRDPRLGFDLDTPEDLEDLASLIGLDGAVARMTSSLLTSWRMEIAA